MRAVPLSRYCVFLFIAGGGLAADLVTKRCMFDWLGPPGGRTYWVWQDVFGFQTSLNEGALFGIGQGLIWFFALLSVAAGLGICWWLFVAGAARQWLLTVALAAIMAGILGNLFDRSGMPGLVWRDTVESRPVMRCIELGGFRLAEWKSMSQGHHAGDAVYAVRDWVLVMIGKWPWPNFNIADSLLVSGAALLVWHALVYHEPKAGSESA